MPRPTAPPTSEQLDALSLTDNRDLRVFVLEVGGHRARLEYDLQGDRIFLTRTEVPKALEGDKVGAALMHKVLTWVGSQKLKLVPISPEVKAYLRRNPEWKRLLVKGLHV